MSDIPYASAVRSIQYVVQCTKPDITYTLSVTGRFQACVGEAHWSIVKTILKCGELILKGYSNASFQLNDDDAKSQSGFVFKLNGGVVSWKSSEQATTAYSTIEAEYIDPSEAAKEVVWMKTTSKS
ncbi:UNVERIFIED_CONTAM: Secreted RxLR effector protein [Sesamum angustifolium]|uniref:Secreted RxLR effector protein n=1 Tax=Sesamum angustifolium TaxID=2727405 RepID=A0AAW2IRT6_9LAMI